MVLKSKLCKIFGHKWTLVYTGGKDFNFVGVRCKRCFFGHDDLLNFVKDLKIEYNTYNKEYWKGEKDINA